MPVDERFLWTATDWQNWFAPSRQSVLPGTRRATLDRLPAFQNQVQVQQERLRRDIRRAPQMRAGQAQAALLRWELLQTLREELARWSLPDELVVPLPQLKELLATIETHTQRSGDQELLLAELPSDLLRCQRFNPTQPGFSRDDQQKSLNFAWELRDRYRMADCVDRWLIRPGNDGEEQGDAADPPRQGIAQGLAHARFCAAIQLPGLSIQERSHLVIGALLLGRADRDDTGEASAWERLAVDSYQWSFGSTFLSHCLSTAARFFGGATDWQDREESPRRGALLFCWLRMLSQPGPRDEETEIVSAVPWDGDSELARRIQQSWPKVQRWGVSARLVSEWTAALSPLALPRLILREPHRVYEGPHAAVPAPHGRVSAMGTRFPAPPKSSSPSRNLIREPA